MSIASEEKKRIEQALERAGVAWQLASESRTRQAQISVIRAELKKFKQRYRAKFPEDDPPDPLDLADENPAKAAIFFDPETQILSEEMRVAVWRLLLGDEIERVSYVYKAGEPHQLEIELRPATGSPTLFVSPLWFDFYVLRRFRATEHNMRPVLQGYYLDDLTGRKRP